MNTKPCETCGSLPVALGLQTSGVLDSSGSPECDCDILTPAERKPNARERKTSINRAKRQNKEDYT